MIARIEQFDMRLRALNESMRDGFSCVERELNSTANMIHGKIEEHDNEITAELTRVNQTLTEEIINNREAFMTLHAEVHGVGDVQSTWI